MCDHDEITDLPEGCTADVRLFPLPNLVMFPHVLQPLHIFETRYCDMLEDALAGDQLIATALLQPGWEQDYDGRPPIAPVVCVGKVVSYAQQGDGRHNILLLGSRRARIRHEFPSGQPFRQAEVRFVDDHYDDSSAQCRQKLARRLIHFFRSQLPKTQVVQEQFDQLLGSEVPLGVLTDIVAFTLNFDLKVKQQLLQQLDVDRRAKVLLANLRALQTKKSQECTDFPPDFSKN
jgi:ATP-dependent Lon protease